MRAQKVCQRSSGKRIPVKKAGGRGKNSRSRPPNFSRELPAWRIKCTKPSMNWFKWMPGRDQEVSQLLASMGVQLREESQHLKAKDSQSQPSSDGIKTTRDRVTSVLAQRGDERN